MIKRLTEVAEEYGMTVIPTNEAYTSSTCPVHVDSCGKRIVKGLFKCSTLNKLFNADIVGALNILLKSITPNPPNGKAKSRKGIGITG